MSADPVVYDKDHPLMRPSLCQECISKQRWAMLVRLDRPLQKIDLSHLVNPPASGGGVHVPQGIRDLKNRLIEHTAAENCGSLEDEQMAAGRVIDAVHALPIGDWVILCAALKKGLGVQ